MELCQRTVLPRLQNPSSGPVFLVCGCKGTTIPQTIKTYQQLFSEKLHSQRTIHYIHLCARENIKEVTLYHLDDILEFVGICGLKINLPVTAGIWDDHNLGILYFHCCRFHMDAVQTYKTYPNRNYMNFFLHNMSLFLTLPQKSKKLQHCSFF